MLSPQQSNPEPASPPQHGVWRVGTLEYDRAGLVKLFLWILLADFTLTLMESVMPALLPLQLKDLGGSNTLIGWVGAIGAGMNMILNPIISTASDRHRGPRGRRIPFLLWPTPFIALFLILTGYSPQIGPWLHPYLPAAWEVSVSRFTIGLTMVFMILFTVCNLFVNCVFWYIFTDLVPSALMGRFMAMMRLVSQLAGFVWGMWLFGLADRHMEALYLGAGLVYLVSFILLCTNVREGEYPPPAPVARREKWWAWIKDYFETTTSAPLWRWLILMVMMFNVAMVSNTYWTFFGRDDLGCSLDFIGQIAAYGSICSIPVILLVGWAVDRFGPVSMVMGALMFSALVSTGGFFQINSPASLMIYGVLSVCGLVWMQAALMPMYNELFPHARFGQFCSVTAVFSMSAVMLGNYGLGRLLDHLGDYRWLMVWRAACWGIGAVAMLMVFIHYRKLGGRQHYRPPAD